MLTPHAQKRLQQRAIPPQVIDLLIDLGDFEFGSQGTGFYFFSKKWKKQAREIMRQNGLRQVDHCLNAYLVEKSNGSILTVGHRYKK